MIQGYNASDINVEVSPIEGKGNTSADGAVSMADVISDLKARRKNISNGGINCIPLPFERFRSEIPGIEQEQYILITASTKAGKTQITSYLYLYSVLDYAFDHPQQCSVHIIYFALEESEMRVKQRYISHLLYQLDKIRLSPSDLRSVSAEYPLPQEILDKLDTPEYKARLEFFDKCVQFETGETSPTGILKICEKYAKSVGDYKVREEDNVFQSYVPHDPKLYKMVFIDHIGLIDTERGLSLKQSIDKLSSEYCVKYLRNRLKFTVVAIQQQAMESEGLEAIKQKRMLPTVATLGDTKYTARDANLVLGLFDPSFFGLPQWLGYKIQDVDGSGLRNYGRFLYVLRGRDGEQGGICPLFFDGAVCNFEELPLPEDTTKIEQYYNRVQQYKTYKQKRKLTLLSCFLFIKKLITHGKNNSDLW